MKILLVYSVESDRLRRIALDDDEIYIGMIADGKVVE